MTLLDLGRLGDVTLPPLPPDLLGAVQTRRLSGVSCPYCEGPVASLLSGCDRDDCRRLELDADAELERLADS